MTPEEILQKHIERKTGYSYDNIMEVEGTLNDFLHAAIDAMNEFAATQRAAAPLPMEAKPVDLELIYAALTAIIADYFKADEERILKSVGKIRNTVQLMMEAKRPAGEAWREYIKQFPKLKQFWDSVPEATNTWLSQQIDIFAGKYPHPEAAAAPQSDAVAWPQENCPVCGERKVVIRGKYPTQPKRSICPCCAQEKLEDYLSQQHSQLCTTKEAATDDSTAA